MRQRAPNRARAMTCEPSNERQTPPQAAARHGTAVAHVCAESWGHTRASRHPVLTPTLPCGLHTFVRASRWFGIPSPPAEAVGIVKKRSRCDLRRRTCTGPNCHQCVSAPAVGVSAAPAATPTVHTRERHFGGAVRRQKARANGGCLPCAGSVQAGRGARWG